MESLSKQQIVLLTLFTSFVTSIATGIVTVTLVDQTPGGVTQVINRVVEHTIERVVDQSASSTISTAQAAAVAPTQISTTAEAVARARKSVAVVVRLTQGTVVAQGFGIVALRDGSVIADSQMVQIPGAYGLIYTDGSLIPTTVQRIASSTDMVALVPATSTKSLAVARAFMPASFAPFHSIDLGQDIIGLVGKKDIEVRTGIVGRLVADDVFTASFNADNVPIGSVIITLQGEVVGVKAARVFYENDNQFIDAYIYRRAAEKGILPPTTVTTP